MNRDAVIIWLATISMVVCLLSVAAYFIRVRRYGTIVMVSNVESV